MKLYAFFVDAEAGVRADAAGCAAIRMGMSPRIKVRMAGKRRWKDMVLMWSASRPPSNPEGVECTGLKYGAPVELDPECKIHARVRLLDYNAILSWAMCDALRMGMDETLYAYNSLWDVWVRCVVEWASPLRDMHSRLIHEGDLVYRDCMLHLVERNEADKKWVYTSMWESVTIDKREAKRLEIVPLPTIAAETLREIGTRVPETKEAG